MNAATDNHIKHANQSPKGSYHSFFLTLVVSVFYCCHFMCMCVLSACIFVINSHGGQKRAFNPPDVKLHVVMSCYVDAVS